MVYIHMLATLMKITLAGQVSLLHHMTTVIDHNINLIKIVLIFLDVSDPRRIHIMHGYTKSVKWPILHT